MKKIIYTILAFGMMIWALCEQTKPEPNSFILLGGLLVFVVYLVVLMNKTPSNFPKKNNENE